MMDFGDINLMNKLVIMRIDKNNVCKQQDKECNGINCKSCQFNKQGVEVEQILFRLRKLYIYWLHKLENLPNDVKANSLASETVNYLLEEEKYQKILGEIHYKEEE